MMQVIADRDKACEHRAQSNCAGVWRAVYYYGPALAAGAGWCST